MSTFLIFLGIIFLFFIIKFVWDSYFTDNTNNRWEEFKKNDPINARKVEKYNEKRTTQNSKPNNFNDIHKYAMENGEELNKCSISMGFVINALNEIEDMLNGSQDCEEYKENLMMAAYVSRKGILDRVDKFPQWLEANFDITIPKSQTTQSKMKMKKAMSLSVERLKKIASSNYSINLIVKDMLSDGSTIQEFEDMLPLEAQMQLDMFCQKE